jgi:hypothetical protein
MYMIISAKAYLHRGELWPFLQGVHVGLQLIYHLHISDFVRIYVGFKGYWRDDIFLPPAGTAFTSSIADAERIRKNLLCFPIFLNRRSCALMRIRFHLGKIWRA